MRSVDEGTPVDEAGGSASAPWRALEAAVAAFVLVAACAVIVLSLIHI